MNLQEQLWFRYRDEAWFAGYTVGAVCRVRGHLDAHIVRQAFRELQVRHGVLRTRIVQTPDGNVLDTAEEASVGLLTPGEERGRNTLAEMEDGLSIVSALWREPFNLAEGALLRGLFLPLREGESLLAMGTHQLIAGRSFLTALLGELTLICGALATGHRADGANGVADHCAEGPPPKGNPDDAMPDAFDYWRRMLAETLPVPDIPTLRPWSKDSEHVSDRVMVPVDGETASLLKAFCRERALGPGPVLLAAFLALLSRYGFQQKLGVMYHTATQAPGLPVPLADRVPILLDAPGELSFAEFCGRVHEACEKAVACAGIPVGTVVEEQGEELRDRVLPPWQASFHYGEAPRSRDVGNFRVEPLGVFTPVCDTALVLDCEAKSHEITCYLQFDTDLFERKMVESLGRYLRVLLLDGLAFPGRPPGELRLVDEAEWRHVIHGFNATETDYPRDASIVDVFSGIVAQHGDRIALKCGSRSFTYGELDARATRLARELHGKGVGPDKLVGLYMKRSPDLVIAILAILKAGGAYLPLDTDYPEERLRFMADDARVTMIITQPELSQSCPTPGDAQPIILNMGESPSPETRPAEGTLPTPAATDLAYVMYTSGSTGKPKGVAVEHRNIVRLVLGTDYVRFGPDEVFLQFAPVSFDASTFEIWGALLHGAQLVISPPGLLSLEELGKLIQEERVSTLWLTSGLFNQMVEEQLSRMRGVRQLLAGGDVLSTSHVKKALAGLPGVTLVNGYGPTEGTTFTCCHRVLPADLEAPSIPIGRPIANTRVYILDGQGCPVPVGVPGELYAGGDGVARGYLYRPELTKERFLPDPFFDSPGARMYRTGDLAKFQPDGSVIFLGRLDNQVKLRGYRIELGEIESALMEHAAVREAVVIMRGGSHEERRLVAYVVWNGAAAGASPVLKRHLAGRLPAHMVPTHIVAMAALPLNANGKVDRNALPHPGDFPQRVHVPPATDTERRLAELWEQLLKVETVGREDVFSELGGHSLLAMRMVNRVRDCFGVELPLKDTFDFPTLTHLASRIDERLTHAGAPCVTAMGTVERGQRLPLSFSQEQLWFLQRLAPSLTSYNIPLVLRCEGPLDLPSLEFALTTLVARHEALRTTFSEDQGVPFQVIHAPGPVTIRVEDLGGPAEARETREKKIHERLKEWTRTVFDLEAGPLLNVFLLRIGTDEHVLCIVIHHIVFDGWSIAPFFNDLAEAYSAHLRERTPVLPALPVQFADFAAWQRGGSAAEGRRKAMAFWRDYLACPPATLDLPTDRPRPSSPTFEGGVEVVAFPASATKRLLALAGAEKTTLYSVLFSFWQLLLARYSGQTDVVTGTGLAGRGVVEIEAVVGFFVNTVVVRTQVDEEMTVRDAIRGMHAHVMAIQEYQHVSLVEIIEAVHPERDSRESPLFNVLFVLQNTPAATMNFDQLAIRQEYLHNGGAKFDLLLEAVEDGEGLQLRLEYNTALYEASSVRRMLDGFQCLLHAAVASPGAKLLDLDMVSSHGRFRLLEEFNDTARVYPKDASVSRIFENVAGKYADRTALIFSDTTLTYGELNRRANQLAHRLKACGVGRDTLVGVCMHRSPDEIVALLAILKAGGAYLPLDPSYPGERLRFMLCDSRASVVIVQENLAECLPEGRYDRILMGADAAEAGKAFCDNLDGAPDPTDLAYVMYTSGSTGTPKGVCVEHRNILRLVCGADYAHFGPDEVFLQFAPISFDASTFEIWGALLHGARLVIAPPGLLSLGELGGVIASKGITTLWLTAGLFHQVVDEALPGLRGVRQLLAGGDVLSSTHVRCLLEVLPETTLINGYGPTECTTFATTFAIASPSEVGSSLPIGRPIANTTCYILDERLRPVPIGVPGELFIGGDGVALGYLNRPELTARRFIPDPFSDSPDARLYRTGDRARFLDDGNIEFLGRLDEQVKIRGFRIEPGEIEVALEGHPAVREVVVAAREGLVAGREKQLVAYVIPAGSDVSAKDLRAWLAERLPDYMVPSFLVMMDAFPLNPSGKVDRRNLPAPEANAAISEGAIPRSEVEKRLAALWCELLKLEKVDTVSRFFDLGGHSLLAVRLMARVRDVLGVEVPLRTFFENATIAGLAAYIEGRTGAKDRDAGPGGEATQRLGCNLTLLQEGRPGPALYCLEGAGSSVDTYTNLVKHLAGHIRVYGIDMGSEDAYPESAEKMASLYLRRIRDEQPEGPYHLAGWSYGGIVAYEMARQLAREGATVGVVGLLDCYGPIGETDWAVRFTGAILGKATQWRTRLAMLRVTLPLLSGYILDGWRLWREGKRSRDVERVTLHECLSYIRHDINRQYSLARSGLGKPRRGENRMELLRDPFVRSVSRRITANKGAMKAYAYPSYPGRVTVFRAEYDPHGWVEKDPTCGWGNLALGGVEVLTVPGNHFVLLREPLVKTLAEELQGLLEKASLPTP